MKKYKRKDIGILFYYYIQSGIISKIFYLILKEVLKIMLILNTIKKKEKKDHYHLILNLDNPRTINSLSNRLDIPSNLIQPIKSLRASCRYLVHRDSDDKKEYQLEQVVISNSFKSTFFKSFDDLKSDDDILQDIYDFINDYSKDINAIELEVLLSQFVLANNYDRIFKRYYNTISKFILYKTN